MAPPLQQLYIPDFLSICNLPTNTHPLEDVVRRETEEWILSYGLFSDDQWEKFLRSDVPRFASRTFPYAGYEKLRNCTDFCLLVFALDDITDDEDKIKGTLTSKESVDAMQSDIIQSSSAGERMITEYVRSSVPLYQALNIDALIVTDLVSLNPLGQLFRRGFCKTGRQRLRLCPRSLNFVNPTKCYRLRNTP